MPEFFDRSLAGRVVRWGRSARVIVEDVQVTVVPYCGLDGHLDALFPAPAHQSL